MFTKPLKSSLFSSYRIPLLIAVSSLDCLCLFPLDVSAYGYCLFILTLKWAHSSCDCPVWPSAALLCLVRCGCLLIEHISEPSVHQNNKLNKSNYYHNRQKHIGSNFHLTCEMEVVTHCRGRCERSFTDRRTLHSRVG